MVERSRVRISMVVSTTKTILTVAMGVLLLGEGTALAKAPKPSPAEICAAAKQTATGLKASRKLTCYAKYTKSSGTFDLATCLQKAETKFATAFHNAEFTAKGIPRGCTTSGDAGDIESLVDDFVAAVVTALPAAPPPTATSVPSSTPVSTPSTTPTPLENDGASCTSSAQCLSGHCVPGADGGAVCCAANCVDMGPASCGTNGTCMQNGTACSLYLSSTMCQAQSCSGSTVTASATCNGTGTCGPSTPAPCPNNLACANATSCATSCTPSTTSGCAANSTCNAGGTACLLNSGQPCSVGSQCLSGVCTGNACQ